MDEWGIGQCEVSGQWSSGSSPGHRIRIHRDVMWCTWLKTVRHRDAAPRRAAPTAVRGLRARAGSLPHFPLPRPDLKRNASSFHAIPATLLSCLGTDNGLNVLFLTPSQRRGLRWQSVSGNKYKLIKETKFDFTFCLYVCSPPFLMLCVQFI